jgi:tRNA U34 5-methylaminomethyl-2-thiouridine-forming methyltransferase MnmC
MITVMNGNLTPPKGHGLVKTEDGSFTLFSEAFQEACHSTAGAKAETLLHYVEGCKIFEKSNLHNPLVILEVGFGLGIGFKTTLEVLEKKHFHFISLELDKNLLEWFRINNPDLKLDWKNNILETRNQDYVLTIIQGDARQTLPSYLKNHSVKWHAIYQDAFSPKRNPTLWTKEWFSLLRDHSAQDVILSTYSASSSIRKGLYETGWGVHKGEKFGLKRTSTRATLSDPIDPEIFLQLERSPACAFTDLNIKQSPYE